MLQKSIVDSKGKLHDHEVEKTADEIVKSLSGVPGMTYQIAYDILEGHRKVLKEAVYHLNHNAAIEYRDKGVNYVL